MTNFQISDNIRNAINNVKSSILFYGRNYFLTDLDPTTKNAINVVKDKIINAGEDCGYEVSFDRNYPDKIVFRKKFKFVSNEDQPDYFRVDSFSGNIIS